MLENASLWFLSAVSAVACWQPTALCTSASSGHSPQAWGRESPVPVLQMGFLSGQQWSSGCQTCPRRKKREELWVSLTWVPLLITLLSSCVSLGQWWGWHGTVFLHLSDFIFQSESRTEMADIGTWCFRGKTEQVVTCLVLELDGGLWGKQHDLALPWALKQYETWESYLLCVYSVPAAVLSSEDTMESRDRHSPFGVVSSLPGVFTYIAWAMWSRHCWWLHITGEEIEAKSQGIKSEFNADGGVESYTQTVWL